MLGKREDKGEGYLFERLFLKSLIESGVPEDLFRRAYFEDYNVESLAGQRMPAWHALAKKIVEVVKEKGFGLKYFSKIFK